MDIEIRKQIEELDELGWSPEEIGSSLDLHPDYVSRTLSTINERRKVEGLVDEGLTQYEVADKLGISQSRVSTLLSGYDYSERSRGLKRKREATEERKKYQASYRASERGKEVNLEAIRRQRETVRGKEASRECAREPITTAC